MKRKLIYRDEMETSVFKQIRERANMTQEDFSSMLGVTVTTLSRWEQGKHEPTLTLKQIKTLEAFLRGLGLRLCDLPEYNIGRVPEIIFK